MTSESIPSTDARIAALENETRTRLAGVERRVRVIYGLATIATVTAFILGANKESLAQGYGVTLAQLLNRVIALETKTGNMSLITDPNTGVPTVRFDSVNVQIVNGTGKTDGPVNGTGNLILGYNELLGFDNDRSGSHNLVMGNLNSYASYSGIVTGQANLISGHFASVYSGFSNSALGNGSAILGGSGGTTHGLFSTISGGLNNSADGQNSSVSGGNQHTAAGQNDWRAGSLFQDQ